MAKATHLFTVGRRNNIGLFGARQIGNGFNRRQLHFFSNGRCAHIQSATEDEREAQHIVHLVRIIRTSRRDNGIVTDGLHLMRQNFRCGIGQCQNQRILGHLGHHLRLEHPAGGKAQEDISAFNHFCQLTGIRLLGIARLDFVHILRTAFINDAMDIRDPDILNGDAQLHQQPQTGQRSSARTRGHQFDLLQIFTK